MARPERNDVDYFPFLCKEGKAMFYIEQKYGNDGYATWVKILRQLAVTNYHYLNLSDKIEFMFLSSKCRVSEDLLNSIINDLCDLGEFNKELWTNYRVLFNEKFTFNISEAYKKRNNKCLDLDGLRVLLHRLGILKEPVNVLKVVSNPHTILDNSKEDIITIKENSNFFKIAGALINGKPSNRIKEAHTSATDQMLMTTFKGLKKEAVLERLDNEYAFYDFRDEMHLRNAFKTIAEKIQKESKPKNTYGGSQTQQSTPSNKGFVLGQKPVGYVDHAKAGGSNAG